MNTEASEPLDLHAVVLDAVRVLQEHSPEGVSLSAISRCVMGAYKAEGHPLPTFEQVILRLKHCVDEGYMSVMGGHEVTADLRYLLNNYDVLSVAQELGVPEAPEVADGSDDRMDDDFQYGAPSSKEGNEEEFDD